MKRPRYRCRSLLADATAHASALASLEASPVIVAEPPLPSVQATANAMLGEKPVSVGTGVIIPKAPKGQADPPAVLVRQVEEFLRERHPRGRKWSGSMLEKRARGALIKVHYPGAERYGTSWVNRAKEVLSGKLSRRPFRGA